MNAILQDVSTVDPTRALLLTVGTAAVAAPSSLLTGLSLNGDEGPVGLGTAAGRDPVSLKIQPCLRSHLTSWCFWTGYVTFF